MKQKCWMFGLMVLCVVGLMACSQKEQAPDPPAEPTKEELLALVQGYFVASNEGDADVALGYLKKGTDYYIAQENHLKQPSVNDDGMTYELTFGESTLTKDEDGFILNVVEKQTHTGEGVNMAMEMPTIYTFVPEDGAWKIAAQTFQLAQ